MYATRQMNLRNAPLALTACATRGPLQRGAQMPKAPELSFPFDGATRQPSCAARN
ncbi:hypothetical protein A2U01_0105851 [Trifolium medium]|uniref:Uncharacterized protein n=1 Tax=Trifolium medium TaxID=97028 RepID=A0A392VAY6_9FABA|nr:hypothetical protein [Trifolium medium]